MGQVGRRRILIAAGAALATPLALAQQPTQIARVGVLMVDRKDKAEGLRQTLAKALGERGWQEGRNLSIDLRHTEQAIQTGHLAASLVATRPDVLIGVGAYPAHSLRDATRTLPIVLLWIADPVGRGLVSNLAHPGGNITGVSHFVGSGGLMDKIVQLLKEIVPRAARIAILINPLNPIYEIRRAQGQKMRLDIERTQGVTARFVEARTVEEIPLAFEAAMQWAAQALIVTADPVFSSTRETIVALATKHRLPAIYSDSFYVQQGGLASYSTDFMALLDRAVEQVDKILHGARPGDLPIEQPVKFILAVNVKTARAAGIEIPPSILLRADRVIE